MSTTVQVCLTNTGTSPLGPNLNIYSNPTSPLLHGSLLEVVPTTIITGNNCPYLLVVPNTTTTVRIFDPISLCYVDILVTSSDVCVTCSLGISGVTDNLASYISVYGLSGTCDNDISNFTLEWYGPNSSTNLAFTSGKGNLFTYEYTHPINSVSSPLLLPGTYISKVKNVELNGIKFSSTGGPGNVVSSGLPNCTDTVNVVAYNCNNGGVPVSPDPLYTHYRNFEYVDSSQPPKSLFAEFIVQSTTKAFAWKFEGLSIYDRLQLLFSGSAYNQPILIEQIEIGTNVTGGTVYTPTVWPKSTSSQSLKKITVLTGLTVNNNDKIIINISPHPTINSTTWRFYFRCLSLPTASKPCLDSYKNKSYKINDSTINYSQDSCGRYTVNYSVSGCSSVDNSSFTTSTLYDYNNSISLSRASTNEPTKELPLNVGTFLNNFSEIGGCGPSRSGNCVVTPGQIKVVKNSTSQVEIYFTHQSDLNAYLTDWTAAQASVTSACGAYTNNNVTFGYYKFITLSVFDGSYTCGDNQPPTPYYLYFHYSSTVTSGNSSLYPGFGYYMYITTPLITENYTCPPGDCNNCGNATLYTNRANDTRNLTGFIRNISGYRVSTPFIDVNGLTSSANQTVTTKNISGGLTVSPAYSNLTYAASGGTNYDTTFLPSLSARTWDWENHTYISGNNYAQTVFDHEIVVNSWSPFQFTIYAKQISNFKSINSYIPVWSSTGGILNYDYVYLAGI